jgi:hypothetical protein
MNDGISYYYKSNSKLPSKANSNKCSVEHLESLFERLLSSFTKSEQLQAGFYLDDVREFE